MQGMSVTGQVLTGIDHLWQSVSDILTTPIGSRVMRRDYGSEVPSLLDAPLTPGLLVDVFAAVAEALDKWEPRLRLSRVQVDEATDGGHLVLSLSGVYLVDGQPVTLEGIVI